MNYVDIIILICVVALISVILYFNVRNFKNNKGGCSNALMQKVAIKKQKNKKKVAIKIKIIII